MRLLIVNADDFGLNASANAGIVACHQAGAVTSTTVMVNAPGFSDAVLLAKAHPSLGVGLHFNLTWGEPVLPPSQVASLVDAHGRFTSRREIAARLLLGRLRADEIRCELQAQFARLVASGVAPTHIDSHQHVHAFGPVFSAIAELCMARKVPMRVPWVAPDRAASPVRRIKRAALAGLLGRVASQWQGRVRWNDGLGSVFDLGTLPPYLEDLHYQQILAVMPTELPVHELMVHPVADAGAMKGFTRVGQVGFAEFEYLRKGRLAAVANEAGFRIGSYRDLW
ncbi:ChbG/HpnK family deacetylase [Flagellatimonas centrodinii]|uniref:carbohydrate deacetylase n=1 Tax=Flagellatimonas centrodinii TaxID=2806210 RepID=UPI001FEF7876|nr:ChbG/HpnK family deacetylase [Flagellatimonas centrodinii]ULQ46696.1 ChbG/HpnK family deacetylase [Flagellatimonas centrodinii]